MIRLRASDPSPTDRPKGDEQIGCHVLVALGVLMHLARLRVVVEEFARLEVREFAEPDEVIGELPGVGLEDLPV